MKELKKVVVGLALLMILPALAPLFSAVMGINWSITIGNQNVDLSDLFRVLGGFGFLLVFLAALEKLTGGGGK